MQITEMVTIKGAREEIKLEALIDTGAEISFIPERLAQQVGAWSTPLSRNIRGVHNQSKVLPLVGVGISFPALNKVIDGFLVAMSQNDSQIIIGMDILNPTGITIDTETCKLSIKNKIWEAFKTVTGVIGAGGLFYIGVKAVDEILSPSPTRKRKEYN